MEERNDWEKLNHITEEYEPDPDLAHRVIERINQREATVAFKNPSKQKILAITIVGLVIAIFLAVFLPVYLTRNRVQIILYSAEEIAYSPISDMDDFVESNNLEIKYFSDNSAKNNWYYLKADGSLAFIKQELFLVSNSDFDMLNLKAIVLQNAEFDFYNNFDDLINNIDILNIKVAYSISEESGQNNYKVKFNYQNHDYFLEIQTADSGTQVIEKYVNMLIN